MQKLYSMLPIAKEDARVLILGSMPGEKSLNDQRYYAFAQNHFWPLMFFVLDERMPKSYDECVERLTARKIAVWDSVYSCERSGSLDKDIKNAMPNDIPGFLKEHNQIQAIAFNGTKAKMVHDKHFEADASIQYLLLPSSSPVPGKFIKRMEDKKEHWLKIREFL